MVKEITRDDLMRMFGSSEKFKLVDVLDRGHYEQEHIQCALNLPVNEIEEKAGEMFKKEEKIVVYCASFDCQASTNAARKLMALGFKNVLDYKGGLKDYKEANLPLEGSLHKAAKKVTSTCSCCY